MKAKMMKKPRWRSAPAVLVYLHGFIDGKTGAADVVCAEKALYLRGAYPQRIQAKFESFCEARIRLFQGRMKPLQQEGAHLIALLKTANLTEKPCDRGGGHRMAAQAAAKAAAMEEQLRTGRARLYELTREMEEAAAVCDTDLHDASDRARAALCTYAKGVNSHAVREDLTGLIEVRTHAMERINEELYAEMKELVQ